MKNIKCVKNKKGITLVALVVTIVVLLILAGVSLNLLIGSNVIVDSKNAKYVAENIILPEGVETIRILCF